MKSNRLLPWVGWNAGQISFVLLERNVLSPLSTNHRTVPTSDPFVEVTKLWWERFAEEKKWGSAFQLAKVCTKQRPDLAYGWENLAWSLHRQGDSLAAYNVLSPLLKKLKLPGPPSGRAAYCLACFCGVLEKSVEGLRWLKLAYLLAEDKDAFRHQALLEPDLREIWPGLPEFAIDAQSIFE
ncbi:MAG TPA: hypothetical protein VK633_12585 [Verrucomicrobiae bacterium]|nr:hypothetical protein [Verrucomicrobiae bacterium]